MGAVLLPCSEVGQLSIVTHQIPELADISWKGKAAGHQIVFEYVGDSLGTFLVRFLPSDCLDVFGVSKNDIAGRFQDVVNEYSIFPCRLHTYIFVIMFCQPSGALPQIIGVGRKMLAFVAGHILPVRRGDTCHDKSFVDIYPAADWINNFSITRPLKKVFGRASRGWTFIERFWCLKECPARINYSVRRNRWDYSTPCAL